MKSASYPCNVRIAALGFYCDDKSDYDDLCRRIIQAAQGDPSPILTVADRAPGELSKGALSVR